MLVSMIEETLCPWVSGDSEFEGTGQSGLASDRTVRLGITTKCSECHVGFSRGTISCCPLTWCSGHWVVVWCGVVPVCSVSSSVWPWGSCPHPQRSSQPEMKAWQQSKACLSVEIAVTSLTKFFQWHTEVEQTCEALFSKHKLRIW